MCPGISGYSSGIGSGFCANAPPEGPGRIEGRPYYGQAKWNTDTAQDCPECTAKNKDRAAKKYDEQGGSAGGAGHIVAGA
jgi:hypothetical protein